MVGDGGRYLKIIKAQQPEDFLNGLLLLPSCCTVCTALCQAGYSWSTKLLTSSWAFVLPLLSLAVTHIGHLVTGVDSARATARARGRHLMRFLLYLLVIVIRTLVLYMGLNSVQVLVHRPSHCKKDATLTSKNIPGGELLYGVLPCFHVSTSPTAHALQ
ncbi:unnamed protein product [Choristocarpus tenellus]